MNFGNILYTIIIYPLELLFEIIFHLANSMTANPGLSIIVLSLTVNFLVLPLYIRADALQKEEKEIEDRLSSRVKRIKETFKGDERFMMLQAYYRLNDYKTAYVFRSTLPLMLQIPFFIAAFRFLSNLQMLHGFRFGLIADLGVPDGMITIAGVAVNVLPILMTSINIVSGTIYAKGSSVKDKVQLYGMALIFLVLLYRSPSGLVFYWTLNNLFSLIKNVFYKFKEPRKVLSVISFMTGIILMAAIIPSGIYSLRQKGFIAVLGTALLLPALTIYLGAYVKTSGKRNESRKDTGLIYILSMLLVSFTVGGLIPAAVIASSAAEFVDIYILNDPLQYVLYSMCVSVGLFIIWMGIYFLLSDRKGRVAFASAAWIVSIVCIIDYLFFGTKLGYLSRSLIFDKEPAYSTSEKILNVIIILSTVAVCYVVYKKLPRLVISVLTSGLLIAVLFTSVSMVRISRDYDEVVDNIAKSHDGSPTIELSRNGKNVVVLMIDRMFGYYIPFLLNEDSSLKESFSGFTYYPNTVSHGLITYVGAPGLFGGYEYTPKNMNARNEELLVDKHNEALKLMPALFSGIGYDVSVFDPPYANYEQISDLSIYDDYPGVKNYISRGRVAGELSVNESLKDSGRRFFMYGLFKVSPVIVQPGVYNSGNYNAVNDQYSDDETSELTDSAGQVMDGIYRAKGLNKDFLDAYNVLDGLERMTDIKDSDTGTFMMMNNITAHEMTLLQLPDYVPAENVDNTAYADSYTEKYDADGRKLELLDERYVEHYHINMAAMRKVAEWLDYLKDQGVYDNTRIIIVSDHAYPLYHDGVMLIPDDKGDIYNCFGFNCALMVKDFNDKEFKENNEFMTNADVPTIALDGIIDEPVNPFTGNKIDSSEKTTEEMRLSYLFKPEEVKNTMNEFPKSTWFTVHDDIFKDDNWKCLGEY